MYIKPWLCKFTVFEYLNTGEYRKHNIQHQMCRSFAGVNNIILLHFSDLLRNLFIEGTFCSLWWQLDVTGTQLYSECWHITIKFFKLEVKVLMWQHPPFMVHLYIYIYVCLCMPHLMWCVHLQNRNQDQKCCMLFDTNHVYYIKRKSKK